MTLRVYNAIGARLRTWFLISFVGFGGLSEAHQAAIGAIMPAGNSTAIITVGWYRAEDSVPVKDELLILDIPGRSILHRYEYPWTFALPQGWLARERQALVWLASFCRIRSQHGIFFLDIDTGRLHRAIPERPLGPVLPELSPDGNEIIFQSCKGGIYALARDKKTVRTLVSDARDPSTHALLVGVVQGRTAGSYQVFFRRSTSLFEWSLWVTTAEGGTVKKIATFSPHIKGCSVSPQGSRIALRQVDMARRTTNLLIYPCKPGSKPTEVHCPDFIVQTLWSPSGEKLLCLGHRLWMYDISTKTLDVMPADLGEEDWKPRAAWLPNGEQFLVGRGPNLWLVGAKSGAAQVIYKAGADQPEGG